MSNENKSAIEALSSSLGVEELARRLLDASESVDRLNKKIEEQRRDIVRSELKIDTVIDLLWIEVCDTEPKLGRNDVISIANRARELLRIDREQREIPF